MEVVLGLWKSFNGPLFALLLTLPRIYAFLGASQLIASTAVPAMPRTAVILSLALLLTPINIEFQATFTSSPATFILYFAKEYAVGFLIGSIVGMLFWVVQAAGGLIDNQRGAAIASSIDPLQGEESTPLGNLFSQAFMVYILTTGAFLFALGILFKSYAIWPVSSSIPIISDAFPVALLALFDNAMRLAFVIAAPIVAIMFVAEFSLAIVSRFSPQVQVFVLAMPIKSVLAIIVLIFYFSTLLRYAERQFTLSDGAVGHLYEIMKFGEKIQIFKPTSPRNVDQDQRGGDR